MTNENEPDTHALLHMGHLVMVVVSWYVAMLGEAPAVYSMWPQCPYLASVHEFEQRIGLMDCSLDVAVFDLGSECGSLQHFSFSGAAHKVQIAPWALFVLCT